MSILRPTRTQCILFVGDALRTLWRREITDVEILRPEFDPLAMTW